QREDEVRHEEAELHQHRLRIVQVEDALQVRNQNVVEARQKSPHEEEHRRDAHRPDVRLLCATPLRTRCCANADCHIEFASFQQSERYCRTYTICPRNPAYRLTQAAILDKTSAP